MRKQISTAVFICLAYQFVLAPAYAQSFPDLVSAFNASDFKAAAQSAESILQQDPKNAQARFYLAKSYLGLGKVEAAEDQLRSCLELSPVGSQMQENCIAALKEISQQKFSALNGKNGLPLSNAGSRPPLNSLPNANAGLSKGNSTGASGSQSSAASGVKEYGKLNSRLAPKTQDAALLKPEK